MHQSPELREFIDQLVTGQSDAYEARVTGRSFSAALLQTALQHGGEGYMIDIQTHLNQDGPWHEIQLRQLVASYPEAAEDIFPLFHEFENDRRTSLEKEVAKPKIWLAIKAIFSRSELNRLHSYRHEVE